MILSNNAVYVLVYTDLMEKNNIILMWKSDRIVLFTFTVSFKQNPGKL